MNGKREESIDSGWLNKLWQYSFTHQNTTCQIKEIEQMYVSLYRYISLMKGCQRLLVPKKEQKYHIVQYINIDNQRYVFQNDKAMGEGHMPVSESLLLERKEGKETNGTAGEDSEVVYKDALALGT